MDGEVCVQRSEPRGAYGKTVKLIDSVPHTKATSNEYVGPWIDISTLKSAAVQVDGTGLTGTVNIEGTNIDSPIAGSAGHALVTAPTATGYSVLTKMPVRWVRARMSGFTAGSVSVTLHGVA